MKILVIPDIHGRHESLRAGFDKFLSEGLDKVILLGDLADSYDRTNEDILRCFFMARDMKELLGDKMEWLIGNHELHYLFDDQVCSGYRADLAAHLRPWLQDNKTLLNVAYQEGNYLFSHAGVQRKWYDKYQKLIDDAFIIVGPECTLADQLNIMFTIGKGVQAMTEVGVKRGGWRGDYGGPFWCDREEIESYGPIKGYHQIVGHTPQPFITEIRKFEGGKQYEGTSVTFCDVLGRLPDTFLTIEIND